MAGAALVYTAEQADRMLPVVSSVLEEIRDQFRTVTDPELRERLHQTAPHNGGGARASQALLAGEALRGHVAFLERHGILLRDPETGLIDFPGKLGGEPVYLCWRLGEARVEWWHGRDRGFADRRRLER